MTTYPHAKLTAFGTLGAGAEEIWSCGMKVVVANEGALGVPLDPTGPNLVSLATVAKDAWTTFITLHGGGTVGSGFLFSGDLHLGGVKAAAVMADGHDNPAIDSVIAEADATAHGAGGAGLVPYSVALVVSLHGTTYRRGAAANGRVYLPVPNIFCTIGSDAQGSLIAGAIPANLATRFANRFGALIDSINAGFTDAGTRKALVSNISTSSAASGLRFQNVTIVTVDNRPDTIRRRSNKLGGLGKITQTLPVA